MEELFQLLIYNLFSNAIFAKGASSRHMYLASVDTIPIYLFEKKWKKLYMDFKDRRLKNARMKHTTHR